MALSTSGLSHLSFTEESPVRIWLGLRILVLNDYHPLKDATLYSFCTKGLCSFKLVKIPSIGEESSSLSASPN